MVPTGEGGQEETIHYEMTALHHTNGGMPTPHTLQPVEACNLTESGIPTYTSAVGNQ